MLLKELKIQLQNFISDEAEYRSYIRKATYNLGKIISKAKNEKIESVYEMYYDFEEPVQKIAGHRILVC